MFTERQAAEAVAKVLGPPEAGKAMGRSSGLTTTELARLRSACHPLWSAFGSTYQVGSSCNQGDFRDIDVRTMLDDDEFDRRFGGDLGRALWAVTCQAVGEQLSQRTGLRVDYQIQRTTEANEKFGGCPRHPVGHPMTELFFAGGGDAAPDPWPA